MAWRDGNSTNGRAVAILASMPPLRATPGGARRSVMSRRRFLQLTDDLIASGERLVAEPDWNLFRAWLLNSDELLERVWGRMDRYHLAWLNVGRGTARAGTRMDEEATGAFVAEVASAKLAVLRTMRSAVSQRGWSLLSEDDDESGEEEH
jgi:hypothetical protein